jgi:hypothetical protein
MAVQQMTVRLPENLAIEVKDISDSSGIKPARILQLSVRHGLPIVRQGFASMGTPNDQKPQRVVSLRTLKAERRKGRRAA